jgi:hypothetical protein
MFPPSRVPTPCSAPARAPRRRGPAGLGGAGGGGGGGGSQLERTGQGLERGVAEGLALSVRLAAANGDARALAEELGQCAATALSAVAKGVSGLGEGALGLRRAADDALRLGGEAADAADDLALAAADGAVRGGEGGSGGGSFCTREGGLTTIGSPFRCDMTIMAWCVARGRIPRDFALARGISNR